MYQTMRPVFKNKNIETVSVLVAVLYGFLSVHGIAIHFQTRQQIFFVERGWKHQQMRLAKFTKHCIKMCNIKK